MHDVMEMMAPATCMVSALEHKPDVGRYWSYAVLSSDMIQILSLSFSGCFHVERPRAIAAVTEKTYCKGS